MKVVSGHTECDAAKYNMTVWYNLHRTFNPGVVGSSPTPPTKSSYKIGPWIAPGALCLPICRHYF